MPVKVECESCQAPYTIDERRIPASGLRVRCPKCSKTFVIKRPTEGAEGAMPSAPPPAAEPSFPARSGTAIGPGAPAYQPPAEAAAPPAARPRARSATIAFAGAPPAVVQAIAAQQAAAAAAAELDDLPAHAGNADLPAIGGRAPARPIARPIATPQTPPVKTGGTLPPDALEDEDELPSPVVRAPAKPPARRPGAATQQVGGFELPTPGGPGRDFDLPAMSPQKAPPPRRPGAPPQEQSTVTAIGGAPNRDDRRAAQTTPGLPGHASQGSNFGSVDLPGVTSNNRDLPAARGAFGDIDLPDLAGDHAFDDLPSRSDNDGLLPAVAGAGFNLPAVAGHGQNLPALAGQGHNLPALAGQGHNLPAFAGQGHNLPAFAGQGHNLPAVAGAGFNLPSVAGPGHNLPAVSSPGAHLPSIAEPNRNLPASRDADPFGDLSHPGRGVGGDAFALGTAATAAGAPAYAPAPGNDPFGSGGNDPFAPRSGGTQAFGDFGNDPFGSPQASPRASTQVGGASADFGDIPLPGGEGSFAAQIPTGVGDPFANAGNSGAFGNPSNNSGAFGNPSGNSGAFGAPGADFGDVDPFAASLGGDSASGLIPDPMSFVGASPSAQTFGGDGPSAVRAPRAPTLGLGDAAANDRLAQIIAQSGSNTQGSIAGTEASIPRGDIGGMGFGEVDLGGSDDGGGASAGDDDMEFGAIPQAKTTNEGEIPTGQDFASDEIPLPAKPAGATDDLVDETPKKPSNLPRYLGAALVAAMIGGATLEASSHGAFFRKDIVDRLHRDENKAMFLNTQNDLREIIGTDSYKKTTDAIGALDGKLVNAPRYDPLLAYIAYANYAHELRYGGDKGRDAHANALLARVRDKKEPMLKLAMGTRDATAGNLAAAKAELTDALNFDPTSTDALLTLGEVDLKDKHPELALTAFQRAKTTKDSPRARMGIVRSLEALSKIDEAKKEATELATKFKDHAASHLWLARIAWEKDKNEKEATADLALFDKKPDQDNASTQEQIEALTVRGSLLLERGRITDARKAFLDAIERSHGEAAPLAQLGLGEVELAAGAYPKALVAFKLAKEQQPTLTQARIGIAKALMRQEKPGDARAALDGIVDPRFAGEVGYWRGQAEEKLNPDKPQEAMKFYEAGIKVQPGEVKPYIALALLQAKVGKPEDADVTLQQAKKNVPPNDKLHLAIGQLRFRQGKYDDALAEFNKSLELQPDSLEALFDKGRTLLRMDAKSIEEGAVVLKQVESKDGKYPGLALEFGYFYTITHQNELALKKYQEELDKDPNNVDVKLQVGRAMVESRKPEAKAMLLDVQSECTSKSASPDVCVLEDKHYLGRAYLNESNPSASLPYLKLAAEKNDTNAAYHLFYGWALVEVENLPLAEIEINRALDLDKSLGDAHWLRAEILTREARYSDAIAEAQIALRLNPARHEAHATLAVCYARELHEGEALGEFAIALKNDSDNPKAAWWRYQVADIHEHNGSIAGVRDDIRKAIEQVSTRTPPPPWLPKLHFFLAEAVRGSDSKEAIKEYKIWLDNSSGSDPARDEAKQHLVELGSPYTGAR